jgi:hypothetical protein
MLDTEVAMNSGGLDERAYDVEEASIAAGS